MRIPCHIFTRSWTKSNLSHSLSLVSKSVFFPDIISYFQREINVVTHQCLRAPLSPLYLRNEANVNNLVGKRRKQWFTEQKQFLPSYTIKVALNPMYRISLNFAKSCNASHPAYQNSIIRKNFTSPFLKYKRLKLKLRVFLAGHSIATVTYSVTKIPTCSLVIGQFFDTMIEASIDKDWL